MTTLPPQRSTVSVSDAEHVAWMLEKADLQLATALVEIQALLRNRDLLPLWDNDSAWFSKEFEPIASHFHCLQRARRELSGGAATDLLHQLQPLVEEQLSEKGPA